MSFEEFCDCVLIKALQWNIMKGGLLYAVIKFWLVLILPRLRLGKKRFSNNVSVLLNTIWGEFFDAKV